ncbi:MAG: molybdate ABC transporter substrate-binding protein [Granulosicoccus sp.]|nr:molybdate ABC transporter substrate-binding protein [Granulosicoccus sp.]
MTTLFQIPGCTATEHSALRQNRVRQFSLWAVLILCAAGAQALARDRIDSPLIAVASSFRGLWPDLMTVYRAETGLSEPRASFASSGLLTTQIRHGAPFELYLSADQATVETLHSLGKTRDEGITLAMGTLVLVAKHDDASRIGKGSKPSPGVPATVELPTLDLLRSAAERSKPFKLAIPNPRHAPYGLAARQALEYAGLWPLPPGQLLSAENAAQTLQFALTGAVDYAIVPTTLIIQASGNLTYAPVDPESYTPVIHQLVLLQRATLQAETLFAWLQGTSAASVLERFALLPDK